MAARVFLRLNNSQAVTTSNCNELFSCHYQLSRMCFSSLQIAGTRRVFLAITKRYEYVSFYCECVSIHYELLRKSFSPLQRALAVFLVIAFVMVEFKVILDKVHDVSHDGTQFNNNTQGVWL